MRSSARATKESIIRMTRMSQGTILLAANLLTTNLLAPRILSAQTVAAPGTVAGLRKVFLAPPSEARPMVRWWWFGVAVEKPEILRELEQMKTDGIGGAELAFVYPEVLDDPAKGLKNLPFLSPAMLDAVTYAQAEGRRLGLRIDVTLCSGWPYGGPATTLAEAAGRLRTIEVAVSSGATTVATPKLEDGESLIASALVAGTPNPPVRRGAPAAVTPKSTWDAASAKAFTPTGQSTTLPATGSSRVALFFVASHTRQQVKRAAVGAEGYVLDPFSRTAVAAHLAAVGEPLVRAFGATPPYAIFSDSLEAYGADWTPTLPAEFKRRRGYDLMPHLPELVAGGSPAAEKVRHDYGVTLTELVNENYLVQINDWAKAHNTKFRSQTYGEPAVSFSSQNLVDLAEGEGPQWRAFSTLRWATSANHVFGHNVTSGETFTWLHSPVFRATPLDMKAEADIDFIMGENQLIFHGWPYSAPQAEYPGWSLYAAAVFNDHNPWHPVMPAVTAYIARMSALLRQGAPANQVAILLPTDDAWASFTPAHVTVTGAMQKLVSPELMAAILSAGYNVDYIDAAAIEKVGFGSHQVLVLPPTDRIPLATLKKINAWASSGGKVISVGRLPSMDAEGMPLPDASSLTRTMVQIPGTAQLGKALHDAVKPDLQIQASTDSVKDRIGFIRRRLSDADLYAVVNTGNEALDCTLAFQTSYRMAQQWDPDTKTASPASATHQRIHLAPYESRVFVFANRFADESLSPPPSADAQQIADLSTDWTVSFVGTGNTRAESTLTDWTADPATVHFSGEAVYSRDFSIASVPASVFLAIFGGQALPGAPNSPPEHAVLGANGLPNPLVTRPGPGMHAYFDPPIKEAALVTINGQPAGALWHPPYRLEVAKLLKPGTNHIEIHVYNTALNAWSALPPHNYKPLIEKYGDRFQMQDLDKVKPISSGILGAIHLVTEGTQ